MAVENLGWEGKVLTLRIRGELRVEDVGGPGGAFGSGGAPEPPHRVLCLLDGFTGWAKGNWEDPAIQRRAEANEERVARLAIVGDPKWKDEALLFAGVPFTAKEVRFFPSAERTAAREWLAS